MNAVERIEAAIQKLEALREQGGGSPWRAEEPGIAAPGGTIVRDVFMYDVHAELIVTLHRTLEVQITILRAARDDIKLYGGKPVSYLAASFLADAILGEAS